MKFCESVPKKHILKAALKLIQSAEHEIFATMNIDEEISTPLPGAYHQLLSKKARKGIKVVRYGYGAPENLVTLEKYAGITFQYKGRLVHYQRMLIVDHERGLFKLEGQVFYTEFKPLLETLVKYAQIKYNREEL